MQELVLFLSVVAGAAAVAAARRFSGGGSQPSVMGARGRIAAQIHALQAEKGMLEKLLLRVQSDDAGLAPQQRDALAAGYQRQLGAVIGRLEKLIEASRHPDLGAVGDGLITLMDQKLTGFDEKLADLSARIKVATEPGPARAEKAPAKPKEPPKEKPPVRVAPIPKESPPVEITTLTPVTGQLRGAPAAIVPPVAAAAPGIGSQPSAGAPDATAPVPASIPAPMPEAQPPRVSSPPPTARPAETAPSPPQQPAQPEHPPFEIPGPIEPHGDVEVDDPPDGGDDAGDSKTLAEIKAEITKSMKKLAEAEVE